jgi:general secretion pathway protein K
MPIANRCAVSSPAPGRKIRTRRERAIGPLLPYLVSLLRPASYVYIRLSTYAVKGPVRSERGAALIIVLWMILVLSLLAASFIVTSRSDLLIARNEVESARANALADAGIARAVMGLGDPNPLLRWRSDGTPYRWPFGGGTVTVTIVSETGKIDLNAAAEEVLESLFAHAGASPDLSRSLAQAALARREARVGAPISETGMIDQRAPAFATVEDLGLLPGISAPLEQAVLPLVTVYSGLPTVDPQTAPRDVLLSLPGADPAEIDAFIAARTTQAEGSPIAAQAPASVARYLGGAAPQYVTIRASAVTDKGARYVRDATVVLRDAQGLPFVVKRWSQAVSAE